jgi:acyl carrier protein
MPQRNSTRTISSGFAAATALTPEREASLRESLKRCSAATYEAARKFLTTGNPEHLFALIDGVIERFVERERRVKLKRADDSLRLREDLGIDSLSMIEIVVVAEDVLQITIHNEDLSVLRTLGDIKRLLTGQLRAAGRVA